MLNVRINDGAYRALGSAGLPSVAPSELTAGLRELLTCGIDRRGDVLVFGGYSEWAGALADPVPVRCTEEKIVTVDSGPASLGGTPW